MNSRFYVISSYRPVNRWSLHKRIGYIEKSRSLTFTITGLLYFNLAFNPYFGGFGSFDFFGLNFGMSLGLGQNFMTDSGSNFSWLGAGDVFTIPLISGDPVSTWDGSVYLGDNPSYLRDLVGGRDELREIEIEGRRFTMEDEQNGPYFPESSGNQCGDKAKRLALHYSNQGYIYWEFSTEGGMVAPYWLEPGSLDSLLDNPALKFAPWNPFRKMFLKRLNKYGAGILINHSVVRIKPINGAEEFFEEYYADNFSWSLYQGDPPVFKFGPMEQFRIMFPYKQKKLDTNN